MQITLGTQMPFFMIEPACEACLILLLTLSTMVIIMLALWFIFHLSGEDIRQKLLHIQEDQSRVNNDDEDC